MDEMKTVAILSALAKGVNPSTGEVFSADSPYQHADVVRALFAAVEQFKRSAPPSHETSPKPQPRAGMPSNVGKPWSEEEDRRLLAEFDRGRKPSELARDLGRTLAGIEARLEKHGKLNSAQRRTTNRYPPDRSTGTQSA